MPLPMEMTNSHVLDTSPDGTQLLVGRVLAADLESQTCELWVAPSTGGSLRRLGNLVAQGDAAAWSPDGEQLVYGRNGELHIARSDGTELRKLASLNGLPTWLRWSADGRRIRFTMSEAGADGSPLSLWEASVDSGQLRHLLPNWSKTSTACCGNWTRNGKYYVFMGSINGEANIWALREKTWFFERVSGEPVRLTTGPVMALFPVPSRDGRRIYINGYQERNEYLRYDLKLGRLLPELSGISGDFAEYSSDGKWVTYISVPEKSLWRCAADGSQRVRLTSPPFQVTRAHWSRDGRRIAFSGGRKGEPPRIYLVPSDGGELQQVTNGEAGKLGDWEPSWSPDAASIAFGSSPQAPPDKEPLHVLDVKTRQISVLPGSEGMRSPRWSPDGRIIAGTSASDATIVLYDVGTQRRTQAMNAKAAFPSWSPDGDYLYFLGLTDAAWSRLRVRDRKAEQIATLKDLKLNDNWFGIGPNNSLVTFRNVGTDEIFGLDWDAP